MRAIEWLLLGVGLLLIIGTAVFVAAEFSLVTVDRAIVERDAEKSAAARRILVGLRTLSTQLSGAQVGITLTTLALGVMVQPVLGEMMIPTLIRIGVPLNYVTAVAVAIAMFLATTVSMILGELIPKNLAVARPLATATWAVPAQRAFTWIAYPLLISLNGTANWLLRKMGVEPQEELHSGRTPEELMSLVKRSAEVGTLDLGTAVLVARSLGLREHCAADIMTPRVQMNTLDHIDNAATIIELARRSGHSRFPVLGEDIDDVIGIVHVKHAVAVAPADRQRITARNIMVPALLVPETVRLDALLHELRSRGLQMAVVADEYGGTAGLVTLEDLVEEIVGEVADEHDRAQDAVRLNRDGTWSIPGTLRPDELRDQIGCPMPDAPAYETAAGYVMYRLGRLPSARDQVDLPGWRISVVHVDGRRIDRLKLRRLPSADHPDLRHSQQGGQR